jgi:hypothetical protein
MNKTLHYNMATLEVQGFQELLYQRPGILNMICYYQNNIQHFIILYIKTVKVYNAHLRYYVQQKELRHANNDAI